MTEQNESSKPMYARPVHIPIAFAGSLAPGVRPADHVRDGLHARNRSFIYEGVTASLNRMALTDDDVAALFKMDEDDADRNP